MEGKLIKLILEEENLMKKPICS